jgi:hypothetical protein
MKELYIRVASIGPLSAALNRDGLHRDTRTASIGTHALSPLGLTDITRSLMTKCVSRMALSHLRRHDSQQRACRFPGAIQLTELSRNKMIKCVSYGLPRLA